MDGTIRINFSWERMKRKIRRQSAISPSSLDPDKRSPDYSVETPEDYLPVHDYAWAIDQLRWKRKVTRGSGLRGGRKCFKSIHKAFKFATQEEMLAADWKLWSS